MSEPKKNSLIVEDVHAVEVAGPSGTQLVRGLNRAETVQSIEENGGHVAHPLNEKKPNSGKPQVSESKRQILTEG